MSDSSRESPSFPSGYRICKAIGRGSYGEVLEAINLESSRQVAIKYITKDTDIERIDTERKALQFDHENVLHMYDFQEASHSIAIITELCAGGDLSQYLILQPSRKVNIATAKRFIYQIASGMSFLHENQVVHRDLKPANILLSECSEYAILKIADFGLAKSVSAVAMTRTTCGTPNYQAPEVLGQKFEYDPRKVDQWSLGIITFEIVAGTRPFNGSDEKKLHYNIIHANFLINPRALPRDIFKIVQKTLRRTPVDRATMSEIKKIVYDLLSDEDKEFIRKIVSEKNIVSMSEDITTYPISKLQDLLTEDSNLTDVALPSELYPYFNVLRDEIIKNAATNQSCFNKNMLSMSSLTATTSSASSATKASATDLASIIQSLRSIILLNSISSPQSPIPLNLEICRHLSEYLNSSEASQRDDNYDDSRSTEDDYEVIESIAKHMNDNDSNNDGDNAKATNTNTNTSSTTIITSTSESELEQTILEENIRIHLFLTNSCYTICFFIYKIGVIADTYTSIGLDLMEKKYVINTSTSNLYKTASASEIYKIFKLSLELYLHAWKLTNSLLTKTQDLLKTIFRLTEEKKKIRFILQSIESIHSSITKRVQYFQDHSLWYDRSQLHRGIQPKTFTSPERLLYHLAVSFVDVLSSTDENNRGRIIHDIKLYVNMINLTTCHVEFKKSVNRLENVVKTRYTTPNSDIDV